MIGFQSKVTFACAAVAWATMSLAGPALADEVRVGGETIRGKVKGLTASGVDFEPEYGSGTVTIPIEKVEAFSADREFYFVHGEDNKSTSGRVQSIHDGAFFVGDTEATAVRIDAATVQEIYDAEAMRGTMGWLRRRAALWHGSFDLGFGATQGTTDTMTLSTGFVADRKKAPSRLTFAVGCRYGKQQQKGAKETTDENEIKGMVRGEYDVIPKLFVFASQDTEYDEIESLSIRAVPKAGMGYRFWDSPDWLFQLETGGAYVYEKYFGGDDSDYFAISFGKLLELQLPWLGSELHWRTDYLPSASEFTSDFLVRTKAALLVPMVSWLKLKIGLEDTYDSTPAESNDYNTFVSTIGVAAVY